MASVPEVSTSCTYHFDNIGAAAQALLTTLLDGRQTTDTYEFGPLSAPAVLSSGLHISGAIGNLVAKLDKVPGAVRVDD